MKRVLITFLFFFNIAFCEDIAENNTQIIESIRSLSQPEITQIESIEKKGGETYITFPNLSLNVGESGIIMRDLEVYQVLVANVEVIQIKGTQAIGKITQSNQLSQPYLPTPRMTVGVGDKVIFRFLNDKAFIIAPNEETYRAISKQFNFLNFINSDLLMGFLNSQGKHDPTSKNLPNACNEYAAGLIFIVGSKSVGIFSCQNMEMIEKYAFVPLDFNNFQAPFFTRIKFDGGGSLTYLFASKKSKEYYKYYDEILGDLILEDKKDSKK